MTSLTCFAHDFARGRRRPRFYALAAMALALSALCACNAGSDLLGAGLPSASGWTRVPTREWLLNEGLGPANIAYCEMPSCPRPTVVATFAVEGEEAKRLSLALADPRSLLKAERVKVATARDPRSRASPRPTNRRAGKKPSASRPMVCPATASPCCRRSPMGMRPMWSCSRRARARRSRPRLP